LRGDRRCAVCGEPLTGEAATVRDPAVQARRRAFKGRLARLAERIRTAGLTDPPFTRNGVALSVKDHLGLIQEAIGRNEALTNALQADLGGVEWDAREADCLVSFQRVVVGLDQSIDLVTELVAKLPPVELRAAHRILTRALARSVRGYLSMTIALTAPNPEAALATKDEGQALFKEAAAIITRLPPLLNQIANAPPDSAWMTDDVLNFATVAWQGVGSRPTTISAAADVVRSALSMIPGVEELHDAY